MTIKRRLTDFKTAMNVGELAEVPQVSQQHIYKLVQTREIPYFRIGASVPLDPLVIARWLKIVEKNTEVWDQARKG